MTQTETPAQSAAAVHLATAEAQIETYASAGGSIAIADILRTLSAAIAAADGSGS